MYLKISVIRGIVTVTMFRELHLLTSSQLCLIVIKLTDLLLLSDFDVVVVVRDETRTSAVPHS